MTEVKIDIEKPEWLEKAIPDAQRTLRLVADGKVPDVLIGRFIVTTCLHLLRCVYGSDIHTAAAIRRKVLEDVEFWQRLDQMTDAEAEQYLRQLQEGIK